MKKKFPTYFANFELPEGAKEDKILVYRACKTNNIDKESFLPTFEENKFQLPDDDISNPSSYSLSTFENPKDVKRFTMFRLNQLTPPCKIAVGLTEPEHGLVQRTKERFVKKSKTSHVDWWLYEDAEPHKEFKLIDDFEEFLNDYKK